MEKLSEIFLGFVNDKQGRSYGLILSDEEYDKSTSEIINYLIIYAEEHPDRVEITAKKESIELCIDDNRRFTVYRGYPKHYPIDMIK